MRLELKNFNVDVVTILPPKLNTDFFKKIQYFGILQKDKIPYSDSRPFYSTEKFARKIIENVEQNSDFVKEFTITKVFLLNFSSKISRFNGRKVKYMEKIKKIDLSIVVVSKNGKKLVSILPNY